MIANETFSIRFTKSKSDNVPEGDLGNQIDFWLREICSQNKIINNNVNESFKVRMRFEHNEVFENFLELWMDVSWIFCNLKIYIYFLDEQSSSYTFNERMFNYEYWIKKGNGKIYFQELIKSKLETGRDLQLGLTEIGVHVLDHIQNQFVVVETIVEFLRLENIHCLRDWD